MKNEGPFLIEWVAHQLLLGADNILVLTNDCQDGTDLMLDRLDSLGVVRHLPNPIALGPSLLTPRNRPHMTGLAYAKLTTQWKSADYIVLLDVDEFPVIQPHKGTYRDLLEATNWPDAISISERLFGSSDVIEFKDQLITETFQYAAPLSPGSRLSRRGVKSIVRNMPQKLRITNHRPLLKRNARHSELHWVDGAGAEMSEEFKKGGDKGVDCRGRYALAAINHYAVRSVESYLVKCERGDAVRINAPSRELSYYRNRNFNHEHTEDMAKTLPALRAKIAELRSDAQLDKLHLLAVHWHQKRIEELKAQPIAEELRAIARNRAPKRAGAQT